MAKKHNFITSSDDTMKLRRFEWTIDNKNNAILSWDWPKNRDLKLMLVFEYETEDAPEIEELLAKSDRKHDVVTRDLANSYTKPITSGKKKHIIIPAFFNEDKGITIVKPAYVTEWLFKKVTINASVSYTPITLGQYHKATLRVTVSDESQIPVSQVLKYAIYEQGRKIGEYELDYMVMSGTCSIILEKDRIVKYILDKNYSHLFNLV
ncbi:MAG: hypothetical protein FWF78_09625 [Defluviitaleaceae bacterium]|nr:hypothetical protein [Defluviitaleaceae bacterium]